MKIWTSEHVFNHPWEMVAQAAWRKYPNPLNPSVVAIDIVDRSVTDDGILKSHRLITTKWGVPSWAQPIFGSAKMGYASEHSVVDPDTRVMTMMSKNLNFKNEMSVIEKLTYREHPTKPGCTLMTQEAVVTIKGVPLSSHLESFIAGSISSNATKGRQAMELVIDKIKEEVTEIAHSVDDIATNAKRSVEELVTLQAQEQQNVQSTGVVTPPPRSSSWAAGLASWFKG